MSTPCGSTRIYDVEKFKSAFRGWLKIAKGLYESKLIDRVKDLTIECYKNGAQLLDLSKLEGFTNDAIPLNSYGFNE